METEGRTKNVGVRGEDEDSRVGLEDGQQLHGQQIVPQVILDSISEKMN